MLLTFFSHFAVPFFTLFLARGTDLFSTNFSSISISLSRQAEFLTWSAVTGGYFYVAVTRLLKKQRQLKETKKETAFFFTAVLMMGVFVLAPYLPAKFPFLSFVHVTSALTCSLLFFLCLLLLTLNAYFRDPKRYRHCLILLIAAAVFCICAFIVTGIINSAMEICFVITCSLLSSRLLALSA